MGSPVEDSSSTSLTMTETGPTIWDGYTSPLFGFDTPSPSPHMHVRFAHDCSTRAKCWVGLMASLYLDIAGGAVPNAVCMRFATKEGLIIFTVWDKWNRKISAAYRQEDFRRCVCVPVLAALTNDIAFALRSADPQRESKEELKKWFQEYELRQENQKEKRC